MKLKMLKNVFIMKNEKYLKWISSDPDILHGKPCIKGTRIPVYLIVSLIAEGSTIDEIIKDYPSLSQENITAALSYAARLTEHEAYAL